MRSAHFAYALDRRLRAYYLRTRASTLYLLVQNYVHV